MLKFAPLLLCTLSSLSLAAEPVRYSTGIDSLEHQVLRQLGHSHELLDIQADGDRFSLLYRPAMTPEPHGALLVVPDPGAAGAWLEQVRALADYLPEHGWSLLAVEPPPIPPPALPERTLPVMTKMVGTTAPAEAQNKQPETDTETTSPEALQPKSYPERLQQRLELAWQELDQRSTGEQQVVVGIGKGAAWSAALAVARGDEIALVVIDPQPDAEAARSLDSLLEPLESHILIDLYHSPLPGYPEAEPDARERRLQAARLGLSGYHQSRLPGVFRSWRSDMPRLARQTRGLLERTLLDNEPEEKAGLLPEPEPLMQTRPGQRSSPPAGSAGGG